MDANFIFKPQICKLKFVSAREKAIPCAWLLSGAQDILRLRLGLRLAVSLSCLDRPNVRKGRQAGIGLLNAALWKGERGTVKVIIIIHLFLRHHPSPYAPVRKIVYIRYPSPLCVRAYFNVQLMTISAVVKCNFWPTTKKGRRQF